MNEITKTISLSLLGTGIKPIVEAIYYVSGNSITIINDKGENVEVSAQNVGVLISMLQSIQNEIKQNH